MGGRNEKPESRLDSLLREIGGTKVADISPEDIERGKQIVDRFIAVYGDMPAVDLISGIWKKRKKSNLIKWLMTRAGLSMDELAVYFGCTKQYLNNKFHRDSFSIEELVITAYVCDYTLALLANDGSNTYRIDPEKFFDHLPEKWKRITGLKAATLKDKRAEYEQKKAELERMKKEYGFED